ncbi:MAG: glutamine synthetase [Deltaproteobacteria bacterium]|nr:glutamine synthetase [Deltaproteobacteria bacterium]
MTKNNLINVVKKEKISFISLQFITIGGEIKNVITPSRDLGEVLDKGCSFDGSSAGFVPVDKSDLILLPDPNSFCILPWGEEENRTARLICDVAGNDNKELDTDPRFTLKRVIKEMQDEFGHSWNFSLAPELEFYLLIKKGEKDYEPSDQAGYFSIPPKDLGDEFRKKLSRILDSLGIISQKNHHEVPKGKHEINFHYGNALEVADNTITYKQVVKYYASKEGLIATFMPKPFFGTYGTGMHIHLNLVDSSKGENLFYSKEEKYNLSEIGRHFLAGLLHHAKALAGITNPSVNSYKRLVPGWEAPVYISWGLFNRSALLRIPATSPENRRVEIRSPDASSNPYLAFAAILVAGLDGIRQKLELPPPINENIYAMSPEEKAKKGIKSLPGNLKEALESLEKDDVIIKSLGEELINKFLSLKWKEWEEFSVRVHPWELEKYLDV